MRYVCAFLFCLLVCASAVAQDSRVDLFAGYSYVNIDTNGLTSRQSANGWETSVSGNFNKWFAVEADVSGYYKSYGTSKIVVPTATCVYFGDCAATVKITDYSFAGGPRINFKPVFIHALFGADHFIGILTASGVPSTSESQYGAAGIVGGGAQFKISGPWSVRVSADYAFTRHNIFGGPSVTQNNYRAGLGIVYSVGRIEQADANSQRSALPRNSGGGMSISALGIRAVVENTPGAVISDEAPNGVAALAGLRPGDVIVSIDGKPVRTPMELAAELASRAVGDKIRVGFLIRGQWQGETVLLLGNH
jgi:hypothetical protein